jgi:flagellar protein FliL
MLRKALVLLLIPVAAGGGLFAGHMLRPPFPDAEPAEPEIAALPDPAEVEYVRLPSQFVVPLIEGGRIGGLVVMSLGLEMPTGQTEAVFAREPRLRDGFLRVLFDHANAGGFRGTFTDAAAMANLQQALLEAARKTLGDSVRAVLITDLVRQDS